MPCLSFDKGWLILVAMKRPDYRKPDHYAAKAKTQGFPARSVFKLQELNDRFHIFRPGMRVLDLGAAPGSWLKYSAQQVGSSGLVLGIDRSPLSRQPSANEVFIQSDIYALESAALAAGYNSFDLVLSDLSPDLSGNWTTDSVRALALCERAYQFVEALLKPGGNFLVKVFQGQGFDDLVKSLKQKFTSVATTKPKSSRPSSREMYVYCRGFRSRSTTGTKKSRR
jgi:23S rRNA (uridine2552-2'-O)-methyltransferase